LKPKKAALEEKSMLKKIAGIGLMFIMASCVGGKIDSAQIDNHFKTTSLPETATIPSTLTASPTLLEPAPQNTLNVVFTPEVKVTTESNSGIESTTIDMAKPSPDDFKMKQGKVFIDTVDFENDTLTISGNLPTPCHKLRAEISDMKFTDQKINISIYSLKDEDLICIQSLAPFNLIVPLELTQVGTYSVVINNEKRFEFNWPENK